MVELAPKKARQPSGNGKDRDKPRLQSKDSTKASVSRQKSIRRDISHPISPQGREIITTCFENPHSEFANKVLQRIFEKRGDYQNYVYSMGKERSYNMSCELKTLIEEVVDKLYDPEYIAEISRKYGEDHVELKQFGFKPDFWVAIADAITVEGVILDMANHQPADTVAAWSSLVTLMFSAVRDGYYTALRKHRMSSRRILQRQKTIDSQDHNEQSNESNNIMTSSLNHNVKRLSTVSNGLSAPAISSRSHSLTSNESNGGTLPRTTGSINIMAPVVSSTTTTSIYNGGQALVTYRQRPIFE
ncbi:unnamed protein product [Auanema sp. JU1783]|nr:unnamed protein product [Auanema sp. JU1783]